MSDCMGLALFKLVWLSGWKWGHFDIVKQKEGKEKEKKTKEKRQNIPHPAAIMSDSANQCLCHRACTNWHN